jgi:hypothetical protein
LKPGSPPKPSSCVGIIGNFEPRTAAAGNGAARFAFLRARHDEALADCERTLAIWQVDADQYLAQIANTMAK